MRSAAAVALAVLATAALADAAAVHTGHADVVDSFGASGIEKRVSGSGTWYNSNGGLGACGTPVYDSQAICAISGADFDPYTPGGNPNRNSLCGSCITISYQGRSASCRLQDRCEGCASGDIDMTPSVFSQLANLGVGRMPVTWSFCGSAPAPQQTTPAPPQPAPPEQPRPAPQPQPQPDPAPAPSNPEPSNPDPQPTDKPSRRPPTYVPKKPSYKYKNKQGYGKHHDGRPAAECPTGCGEGIYWATGKCVGGKCVCTVGWKGERCTEPGL